jgi:hypothetical protein
MLVPKGREDEVEPIPSSSSDRGEVFQGTIEAYRLDIEKGLIPFLHQRGKFEAGEVTKADIYNGTILGCAEK